MSESESVVDRGNEVEDDDCPLCLEPLPPFWDRMNTTVTSTCCGHDICIDCYEKRNEFLDRAFENASLGMGEEERRQVEQLDSFCPLCRTDLGTPDGKMMKDKFEEGRLPLHLYRELGLRYIKGEGGMEENVDRGMEILMLGAEKGDPICQYSLGGLYRDGEYGAPKSLEDAKRWYSAATEQGHAIAELGLALLFKAEGNDTEYLRYLTSSASKGCDEACYNLGVSHYNGRYGLQLSTEEAIHVLMPAAERGHAKSMGLLGYVMCCPDNGEMMWPTLNPNFTQGLHQMRRAATKGDEKAIEVLAPLEEEASGVCFMCRKKAPKDHKFLRCSRCRAAWYCSKDCQRQHWKAKDGGHKQFCIKWGG